MRALVKTQKGVGNVELLEVESPKVLQNEVKIKIMSAGICGTDIKIYNEETWSNPPVILGHEYSGVVESIGEKVTSVKVGDRVVSETPQVICGNCKYCKTGRSLMCNNRLSIGYGVDGAFAEYIVVREEIVHKIPDSLSFDEAALCEPFAVALHGVWDTGEILPTDTVLVVGPGGIGILSAIAAKIKGADVILLGTKKDAPRLEIAKAMGISMVMDSADPKKIERLTSGNGIDVVIDCSGAEPAIYSSMKLLNPLGRFVQIGLTKQEMNIPYSLLTDREISIIGSFGHMWHNWEQAISLMSSGKADVKPIITGHYSLEDWKEAFEQSENLQGVKIMIHPNG